MKTRPLIISKETQAGINVAVGLARAEPIPWAVLSKIAVDTPGPLALKDRKPGPRPKSWSLEIPVGYRAAISFEEQPAGLCRHLSISVEDSAKGMLPSVDATRSLMDAFGFKMTRGTKGRVWLEEFAAGEYAVNVVQVEEEARGNG